MLPSVSIIPQPVSSQDDSMPRIMLRLLEYRRRPIKAVLHLFSHFMGLFWRSKAIESFLRLGLLYSNHIYSFSS